MSTVLTMPKTAVQTRVESPAQGTRLTSLDVFRGMTIAAMILVNNSGDGVHTYWPLEHAKWNGWTPTDLIFPFFLFIVGVSMVFSFASRAARGQTRKQLLLHALKRSAIIFALGLFLYAYPRFDVHTARIPGVLQRIAVVYLISSALVLYTGRITRGVIAAALLLGYWLMVTRIPVPGIGAGVLTMDGNLVGYIDRSLIYNHLWIAHRFDPEGLLSTLPSIATCLLGVFTGEWMRSTKTSLQKLAGLFGGAAAGIIAGEIWNLWFPINKMLWTSSFVLFTAGFAMFVLGLCYWAVDVRGWKRWSVPFLIFGVNPLGIYFLASFAETALYRHHIHGESIKNVLYDNIFTRISDPYIASLAWSISFVLVFFLVAWLMYRKQIFIRV
ncbi:MAG TPA: heparan-alpha-glucosaminide N-acetyltransferase domain-containing protein [Terriglobales bacterium]|nr:heparan-alpha-glucosaminide N-acetyltransferase domain-containing protein [Terriglobales bacterium]